MFDLPGVVVFATDNNFAARFERVPLIFVGDLTPTHRHGIAKQDVRRRLILADGITLCVRCAVPAHQIDADRAHERRFRLALTSLQPPAAESAKAIGAMPSEEAADREGVPAQQVKGLPGAGSVAHSEDGREEI